jgi:thymidylate synthase
MQEFEKTYVDLVLKVLANGYKTRGRNGNTLSLFGEQIKFTVNPSNFPILQGRKIYYAGVIGEFIAFINNYSELEQFESVGCNYWKTWADNTGHLEIDYAKQLHDFNGINQLENLLLELQVNPYSRRHIISLWRPDRLDSLSLPCCHYAYQFNVNSIGRLDMVWIQRSVDTMVGLPSDMILASLWVYLVAKHCDLLPGNVTMQLGNVHIYEEHLDGVRQYLKQAIDIDNMHTTKINRKARCLHSLTYNDIEISDYVSQPAIKFELKA